MLLNISDIFIFVYFIPLVFNLDLILHPATFQVFQKTY